MILFRKTLKSEKLALVPIKNEKLFCSTKDPQENIPLSITSIKKFKSINNFSLLLCKNSRLLKVLFLLE